MRIELHFELSVSPKVVDDHFTTQNSISIDNLNVIELIILKTCHAESKNS